MLLPRDHCKTTILRSLACHLLIQSREANIYFPGCQDKICMHTREGSGGECSIANHRFDGCDTRILLGYKKAELAEAQLNTLENVFMNNTLLRGFWPHRVWNDDTTIRTSKARWNKLEMEIPRNVNFPEASISRIGVDGSIAGRHFNCHLFDDLTTEEAAGSELVMSQAIQWFKDSRALMDDLRYSLEFTFGTHWAHHDLPYAIMNDFDNHGHGDPTVESHIRSIVEEGKIIFPEMGFTPEGVERLERSDPAKFQLMYMNNIHSPELVDFSVAELREFDYAADGRTLTFADDDRDMRLANDLAAPISSAPESDFRGMTLNEALAEMSASPQSEYLKMKYGQFKTG